MIEQIQKQLALIKAPLEAISRLVNQQNNPPPGTAGEAARRATEALGGGTSGAPTPYTRPVAPSLPGSAASTAAGTIGPEMFSAAGEARNALARAVFSNRQGELRDRTFESQRYRASGLNLVVLAIILWNTIYLERAINALREHGIAFPDSLLTHVSPIGWEHINLTGDYTWHPNRRVSQGRFRPLRPVGVPTTVPGASS